MTHANFTLDCFSDDVVTEISSHMNCTQLASLFFTSKRFYHFLRMYNPKHFLQSTGFVVCQRFQGDFENYLRHLLCKSFEIARVESEFHYEIKNNLEYWSAYIHTICDSVLPFRLYATYLKNAITPCTSYSYVGIGVEKIGFIIYRDMLQSFKKYQMMRIIEDFFGQSSLHVS